MQRRLQTIVLRVVGAIRIIDVAVSLLAEGVLDHAETVAAGLLPALVCSPAEIARARRVALGVKTGVLIERNQIGSVGGAEDMTAVAAVVTTEEETEGGATGG